MFPIIPRGQNLVGVPRIELGYLAYETNALTIRLYTVKLGALCRNRTCVSCLQNSRNATILTEQNLEPEPRIELGFIPYQRIVLPLYYSGKTYGAIG